MIILMKNFPSLICLSGVSCDSCLRNNFRGRRYTCLICFDYDSCATCYENGVTSNRHTLDHPMQCILTRSDFGKYHYYSFIEYLRRRHCFAINNLPYEKMFHYYFKIY